MELDVLNRKVPGMAVHVPLRMANLLTWPLLTVYFALERRLGAHGEQIPNQMDPPLRGLNNRKIRLTPNSLLTQKLAW